MGDAKSNSKATYLKPIRAKYIIRSVCLFLIAYGLLMAPWPGLATAYTKAYRASAAFMFKSFGSKGVVLFRQSSDTKNDVEMLFFHRDRVDPDGQLVPLGRIPHNTRYYGYMPTAFLIALVLATPIPLKRKGRALFWAMVIIHALLVLKLVVWVLFGFSHKQVSVLVLSPFWNRVFVLAADIFLQNLTFALIVSFSIWILVTFRREDWPWILMQKMAPSKTLSRTKFSRGEQSC